MSSKSTAKQLHSRLILPVSLPVMEPDGAALTARLNLHMQLHNIQKAPLICRCAHLDEVHFRHLLCTCVICTRELAFFLDPFVEKKIQILIRLTQTRK